ncbi:hypothetical protein NDU88_006675 [Pleurodeles waltl]|uniref:Uncharacterized protein n=1 Tax=Pleurodeles waltl TaxID=8319 RepID=A0AAV7QJF8_PLEWA|nr:hypothetical protein NDU88_006675 [Pleurodeles waltl]
MTIAGRLYSHMQKTQTQWQKTQRQGASRAQGAGARAESFSFRMFSDMSIAAVHRRRKFVGLIDDFERCGAPAGIVQLAKL